jgi:hypothetical protein
MKKLVMMFASILSLAGLAKADQILKKNFTESTVDNNVKPHDMVFGQQWMSQKV